MSKPTPHDDSLNVGGNFQRFHSTHRFDCEISLAARLHLRHVMESKATELNARIRRTIEQLAQETDAARQSQMFRDYLRTSAAFWDYSWHNQMLIWRQKPDASFVAGYQTWLKCGRYVRKGEKGIAILAPMFFKDKRRTQDGSEEEVPRIWFKVVYVFDISQTDGTPLPELPTESVGERGAEMLSRLLRFAESQGITVRFVDRCSLNGAFGTSRGKEIEIRTSETDTSTQAATLAHEIAHSLLHWTANGHKITTRDGKEIDKRQRELEAEATAYVVCSYFGIQSPSDFYLAAYQVSPAMLLEAVETISGTVKTVLTGCQESPQLCAA
jgi:antirestriction protein ArdC